MRATRAVFLPEAGKKRLSPEILKLLSGSDTIPCREYYQGHTFSVPPTWALIATSNDPPNLTAYDDALKDRIMAIPFVHKLAKGEALEFTGGKRIEDVRRLPESPLLRGFVAWAVEGLARVHRNQAIGTAAAAERQTLKFWKDTDPLTPFWAGLSEGDLRAGMTTATLRGSYLAWCEKEGIHKPLAARTWGEACHAAGLESYRTETARGWRFPEGVAWPYANDAPDAPDDGLNDGMTDYRVFSETFPNEIASRETFDKKALNPSFRQDCPADDLPPLDTSDLSDPFSDDDEPADEAAEGDAL